MTSGEPRSSWPHADEHWMHEPGMDPRQRLYETPEAEPARARAVLIQQGLLERTKRVYPIEQSREDLVPWGVPGVARSPEAQHIGDRDVVTLPTPRQHFADFLSRHTTRRHADACDDPELQQDESLVEAFQRGVVELCAEPGVAACHTHFSEKTLSGASGTD